jgi:hypothetical protein
MTKTEILSALENIKNNFLYGNLATRLIPDSVWEENALQIASFKRSDLSILEVPLENICNILLTKTPQGSALLISEFESGLMRSIMRESHEIVLKYCETTGQFQIYKNQSWFQFFRIMRNTVSHKDGGNLHKWPDDLKKIGITSVQWKARTLDVSMEGMDLEFSIPDALDMWFEIFEFVKQSLS